MDGAHGLNGKDDRGEGCARPAPASHPLPGDSERPGRGRHGLDRAGDQPANQPASRATSRATSAPTALHQATSRGWLPPPRFEHQPHGPDAEQLGNCDGTGAAKGNGRGRAGQEGSETVRTSRRHEGLPRRRQLTTQGHVPVTFVRVTLDGTSEWAIGLPDGGRPAGRRTAAKQPTAPSTLSSPRPVGTAHERPSR